MNNFWNTLRQIKKALPVIIGILVFMTAQAYADIYVNVLAVNGTDKERSKNIHQELPQGLVREDILDTDGLEIGFDLEKGIYYVHGEVVLEPKESKTFRILISDIWQINDGEVQKIKSQIDASLKRIEGTEYYDVGNIKKASLEQRLDFIVSQQDEFADDVEKRISRFQTYADELEEIRSSALSVKYWRSRPPSADEANIISFIVQVENSNEDKVRSTENLCHYLPPQVKPEHLVNLQEFEIFYDALKKKSYLRKTEDLQPSETKRYVIGIIDVWNIAQIDIENLRDRARKTYKLLENTEYVESAGFLMANIKEQLETIERSQLEDRPIQEHILEYDKNLKRYTKAETDVKTLEEMLEAVRETLERSKVKNVLKQVKSLKSIVEIARTIFKRPQLNMAWYIILGVCIFVGLFAISHFTVWGKRSREQKEEEEE